MSNRHSTSIRMPVEIKEWAEKRSIRNHRSLSAEIIAILSSVREGENTGSGFEKIANPSGVHGDAPLFERASRV